MARKLKSQVECVTQLILRSRALYILRVFSYLVNHLCSVYHVQVYNIECVNLETSFINICSGAVFFLYIRKGKAILYWNLNITGRNRRALSLSPDSRRIWREHSRWSRCLRCHCSQHNSPRGKTCNGNNCTILRS